MTTSTAAVHVVDDDTAVRVAILRFLAAAGYNACGYSSAGDFLQSAGPDSAGCMILDVCMPGLGGLELQEVLSRRGWSLPIIFLTGRGDIPTSVRAIKAGAEDFLTKPIDRDAMLFAVQKALDRECCERERRSRSRDLKDRFAALTPREQQVFWRVTEGKLNKQVASELSIAERTVKLYRHGAMEKLHARTLAQLIRMADQLHADAVNESLAWSAMR
jgi:FixJ family two-component response regulator